MITVSTWKEDDSRVAVATKDTGRASNLRTWNRFQPFYSTKGEIKGTGLDLSISHGIIQGQSEIRIASQPGKGATFTVLLPINSGQETALNSAQ